VAVHGSGTTLIAAERTGRCCYGIELDAAYADAIIRRWQAFTGDQAMRETAKLSDMLIADLESCQALGKCVSIELRIGS
jgi:hypothetical protein